MILNLLLVELLTPFLRLYAAEEIEDLLRQLQSEDLDEREEAVEILGQAQDQSLIEPLSNIMLKHKNGEVRSAAAITLFRIGSEKARESFVKALKDPDISVQLVASGALYKFGDPKALGLLEKALEDPNQEVRLTAVAILGEIGDAKSVEFLKPMLQDPDEDIRELVRETLEELNTNILQVVKTDSSPTIDGIPDDPSWAQANPLRIATELKTREGPTVILKALQKEEKVYLLAIWSDPSRTQSINHKPWTYNGTNWESGKEEEDRLAMIFPITSIPPFSASSDKGCTAMCHKAKAMSTNTPTEVADLWIWRAARSNPVAQADDWLLGSGQNLESDGRKADAMEITKIKIEGLEVNQHGYTINLQEHENRPLFIPNSDKDVTGTEVLLTTEAIPFNSKKKYAKGDSIPGFLVAPFVGSRGDIQAKGVYREGSWVVEICRLLNTGHSDDVKFEEGKESFFSLKVFDGKEFYTAKEVYKVRF